MTLFLDRTKCQYSDVEFVQREDDEELNDVNLQKIKIIHLCHTILSFSFLIN